VENLFQDTLAEAFHAKLKELSVGLVDSYGQEEAGRLWEKYRPRAVRRGAPSISHDLKLDRKVLFAFRQFEASAPFLSRTAAIKAFATRHYRAFQCHSAEALATRIRRLTASENKKPKMMASRRTKNPR
jgi:hypothetical protein